MGIIEGFGNVSASKLSDEEKNRLYNMMLYVLAMKLLFIYVVAYYIWPRVMPGLFPGVNANPTFLQLLGFCIMVSLLL
jgi:hypothetical protein